MDNLKGSPSLAISFFLLMIFKQQINQHGMSQNLLSFLIFEIFEDHPI